MRKFSKVKARRVFRSRKRQVGDLTESASQHIDRHVFRRLNNFAEVGRFMIAWVLLLIVLTGGVIYQTRSLSEYYLTTKSTDGGILTEGIIGSYTTPNPLFASTTIDLSVSKLIFNSLLSYDENGVLVNDLAASIKRSDDGLVYTVALKEGVLWQDGTEFTSKDVLYTYKAIQNPDTRSPYIVSWRGVTIAAPEKHKVTFTLPAPINAFPLSLTTGIVPSHILKDVDPEQLRSSDFNFSPVGTGPYKLSNVVRLDDFESIAKRQRIETVRNDAYFKGRPSLEAIVVYALTSEQEIQEFLDKRTIDSAVFNSNPGQLGEGIITQTIPLLAGSYVFFNTSKAPFDNLEFRKAIASAINVPEIIKDLGFPVQKVDSPLLSTHVGYDPALVQTKYNIEQAKTLLDQLGYKPDANGIRQKDGKQLQFSITTLDESDFSAIASGLQSTLNRDLGIKVDIITKKPAELQPLLLQHSYDALIYGITLSVDPDVYAYWHSSQAINDRFNLSMYKSTTADSALEAGRSRPDIDLRAAKYKPFLESWVNDVPAKGLYQPPVFYVSRVRIYGFEPQRLNSTPDRFYNVHNWQITTAELPIIEK